MHRPADNYPIITVCNTSTMEKLSSPSLSQRKGSGDGMVLEILHRLLDQNDETLTDVISWTADGASFRVHDTVRFEHYLMPVYFGAKSAYCNETKHNQREPLTNYDSFSRVLQTGCGFHVTGFRNPFLKDTYNHALFVRGKRDLVRQIMITMTTTSDENHKRAEPLTNCDSVSRALQKSSGFPLFARGRKDLDRQMATADSEPTPMYRRQGSGHNWPMPALLTSDATTNNTTTTATNSGYHHNFQWPSSRRIDDKSRRPLPRRVMSSSKPPTKRRRNTSNSNSTSNNKRQYSASFRETLLHRKRGTICEPYAQTAMTILDDDDDALFEPLDLTTSTSCNGSLDVVGLFCNSDHTPVISNITRSGSNNNSSLLPILHQNDDDEPLDPSCHEDDDSLHGDIAEALARI